MSDNPKNTVAHENYRALMELAPGVIDGTYSYMRFQAGEGFMPLTFEHLYDDRYSLMHFYDQNGDLMRDPDMEIVINREAQTVEAMTFTQHPFIYQEVEPGNTRLQGELNSFLSQWLSNIKEQEYTPERAIQYDRDGNRQEVNFIEPFNEPPPEIPGNVLSVQIRNKADVEKGEWLKLPTTAEQLQEAMRHIGITAENPQDFYINGIDSPIEAVARLPFEQIQAATVDEFNYLAARLETLDAHELETLNAAGEIIAEWDNINHLTEYAGNTEFFVYIPNVTDYAALGKYYLDKSQMIQMPEAWKPAVDTALLGQLAAENEKGLFTDKGYILESGDEWEPTTEIPQEYHIISFPQPEPTVAPETPEQFAQDFSQIMESFYKEHPPFLESVQMANTSPSFIAHQIEIGYTSMFLDPAINTLEDDPAYKDTALLFRQRLEAIPKPERSDNNIIYDEIATRTPAVAVATPPAQEQPQPVKPIMLESEKPADRLKEITDKLESGIAGIFESEQYKDYLKTLSKFHNYSLNNTILIAMQKPDATRIAGFSAWKSNFERSVRKGEKGIKILAPSPFKLKKEMEKIDPNTQRPVVGKDGKPVTEEVEITIPAFKVVSVFDVSQTEGKELPNIGVNMLTGNVEQYKDFFAALEKASPVPIAFENIERSANGYYHLEDKRIAIKEGMSELQTLKTAIHEIAHARLHDIDVNNKKDEQPRVDSRTREVEAESIAYTVCQHYELDTSEYSFGYVAGWSSGKELTELKASLETIRTAAAELIAEIDGHFAEHWQDKERAAEQGQQPGYEKWSEPATAENAPDNPGIPSDDINAYLPQHDTFSIYQLKQDDSTRDMRFEPFDRLQAAGQSVDRSNYELVYTAPISEGTGNLEQIFEKFNTDRPQDFTGHSLSVSDIVTLNRDGQETAHYVDSFGFKEVPQFLQPEKPFDMQQTAAEPPAPDNFLTGEKIKTPRGSFSLTDMTTEQMKAAGYGYHHSSDDGKYHIMGNGTRAFAIANENNPLRTAEMSTEQNYNMIDGIPNNRPTVDELEKQVKAGQTISLLDLAHAVKAEQRGDTGRDSDKKPSILAQLAEGKAAAVPKKAAAKTQSNDLEV